MARDVKHSCVTAVATDDDVDDDARCHGDNHQVYSRLTGVTV